MVVSEPDKAMEALIAGYLTARDRGDRVEVEIRLKSE